MSKNEKIYIGVEEPFVLNSTEQLWLILAGEVNIFYTKIDKNGKYLCALKHLYAAKKGEIIFSLLTKSTENDTRLVVFSENAVLLPVNKSDLLNVDHLFLKNMINKWILKTSTEISCLSAPRVYKPLDSFEEIQLNENSTAYPSNNINWINLLSGNIEYFSGNSSLSAADEYKFPVPVSNKLWITGKSKDTRVRVLSTREVIEENINFLISIDHLLFYFNGQLNKNIAAHQNQEQNYFDEKLKVEQKQLTQTLEKIKSIVTENTLKTGYNPSEFKSSTIKNTLFATCKIIAEHAKFKIEEPKHIESYQNSTTNQLYAIAKSSNLRVRKIILRGVWWKEENGDLLAFTKTEKIPVALIQKNSETYILKNSETGMETVVNYEVAESLEPIGYMFFSGFDKKMGSMKQVLSFAMTGVKNDGKKLILAALAGSLIGLLIPIMSGKMFDDVIPTADR